MKTRYNKQLRCKQTRSQFSRNFILLQQAAGNIIPQCGIKYCILAILAFSSQNAIRSQDIYNYSSSKNYADYLYQSEQYQLSAIEYERVLFLNPADSNSLLNLVDSYIQTDNISNAELKINRFFSQGLNSMPVNFSLKYTNILILKKQYNAAYQFLENNAIISQKDRTFLQSCCLLNEYNWEGTKNLIGARSSDFYNSEGIKSLHQIALNGMELKYKQPIVAAMASAIIPGSGKCYSNYWKDGFYAFLFIGSSALLSYHAINHDGASARSILFSTITASFYLSNIFGSYKSAKTYNEKINKQCLNRINHVPFYH